MKLTPHAKLRIAEMGLHVDEVMAVVREPEVARPDPRPHRSRLSGGRLVVIVEYRPAPHAHRIVTVLWRSDVPLVRC